MPQNDTENTRERMCLCHFVKSDIMRRIEFQIGKRPRLAKRIHDIDYYQDNYQDILMNQLKSMEALKGDKQTGAADPEDFLLDPLEPHRRRLVLGGLP